MLPNIIHYAIPFFVLTLIIEGIIVTKKKQVGKYTKKDTIASISMGLGNVILKFGTKLLVVPIYYYFTQFALFEIPMIWWSWILILFAD